jgi:hypothetical protein
VTFAAILVVALAVLGIVALTARRIAGPGQSGRPAGQSPSVAVTSEGVTVRRPGTEPGHVAWNQLIEVAVVTTSAGPLADDVFLVLRGADAGSCLVPNPLANELVPRLLRLPGFDHEKFIAAMGSTSEAAFVCWTGRPGDGKVAAGAPSAGGTA